MSLDSMAKILVKDFHHTIIMLNGLFKPQTDYNSDLKDYKTISFSSRLNKTYQPYRQTISDLSALQSISDLSTLQIISDLLGLHIKLSVRLISRI